MLLEALEGHERIEQRVVIVETDDQTQREPAFRHRVDEAAAELLHPQRVSRACESPCQARRRSRSISQSSLMPIAYCSG